MNTRELIKKWFEVWERGNYLDIPIADDFRHCSPYGIIVGKKAYLYVPSGTNIYGGDCTVNYVLKFNVEK